MDPTAVWASGDAYERYVGRWSRLVAAEFVDWLAVEPGRRWLDVGCGTGALTATILARADPAEVVGVDPSPAQLESAERDIRDARARFVVGDAGRLPAAEFDVAVSGLVLNFVPDPGAAVAAMVERVPSGAVGAYVWDYAGRMELMRRFWDAAAALDPGAAARDEASQFPICHPDALAAQWRDAGLDGVETRAIDAPTVFADFQDFWTPFEGGQGPAPRYAMSLDEGRRGALRDRLRATLPTAGDGSISLIARAWAVRGRRK
jgi:SAM-dependent methyltransferase